MAPIGSSPPDVDRRQASVQQRALHADLHRFVFGRVRDRSDSDDLVQETFVRLYAYRNRDMVANVAAFCFAIARNLVNDHFRTLRATPPTGELPDSLPCSAPRADDVVCHRQRVAVLTTAIRAMPVLRREVFLRRRLDGDSIAAISHELNLSPAAVEKHVSRAIADLRKALNLRGLWIGDLS